MNCALLDMGCHIVQVGADLWSGISVPSKLLILAGLAAVISGCLWSWLQLMHRVGGWPAVLGFIAVAAGLLLALLPQQRRADEARPVGPTDPNKWYADAEMPSSKGPFTFGIDRVRKKPRPTILDGWRRK